MNKSKNDFLPLDYHSLPREHDAVEMLPPNAFHIGQKGVVVIRVMVGDDQPVDVS